MRSVAELKRLLRNRVEADTEFGKTLVELIVVRLKDQGYLNDARYAAAFSSYRRDNEKFGRMRVVNDLKAKGVHGDVIEKAVSSAYDEVKEETSPAPTFVANAFRSQKTGIRNKQPASSGN